MSPTPRPLSSHQHLRRGRSVRYGFLGFYGGTRIFQGQTVRGRRGESSTRGLASRHARRLLVQYVYKVQCKIYILLYKQNQYTRLTTRICAYQGNVPLLVLLLFDLIYALQTPPVG